MNNSLKNEVHLLLLVDERKKMDFSFLEVFIIVPSS